MSKLLKQSLGIGVALNTSPSQLQAYLKAELTDVKAGWQVIGESDTDAARYIDVIPPAAQQIGNAVGREVLRISQPLGSGTLVFQPYLSPMTDRPPAYKLVVSTGAAGNVQVKIGANTLTIAVPGGNQDANTLALYNALVASADAEAQKYTYQLVALTGNTSDDYIVMTGKTAAAGAVSAVTNCTVTTWATAVAAGSVPSSFNYNSSQTLSIDLASGFVYYLSIFERTLAIATKTTALFTGPVFCSWADHASALAQTPSGCSPVQLVVLNMNTFAPETPMTVTGLTHAWGAQVTTSISDPQVPAFDKAVRSVGVLEDVIAMSPSYSFSMTARALNTTGLSAATWAAVFGLTTGIVGINLVPTGIQGTAVAKIVQILPTLALPDVLGFIGAATDESIQFTQAVDDSTALTAALGIADAVVTVADTTAFNAAGVAIIGNEAVKYTGKTATTLTGVTRGQYATVAAVAVVGAKVYPALYYMKAKGAALLAGYTDPSAA